ncbi:hypothetical protein [Pseudorhodoferax aquiterrae]|uniref:hypothetical protein n=1 Tax=Pseudorhodoferax aquiterrae TaxID=747304 RepID=UPI0016789D04|nr:hypothetical protein [Pseudorhodoferax aquiterrae]
MKSAARSPSDHTGSIGPATLSFAIALLAIYTIYILVIRADVAYMDSLRFITYYPSIQENWLNAFAFWNQGQHTGLILQLTTWVNIAWFRLDPLIPSFLSGVVLLLISLLLCKSLPLAKNKTEKALRCAASLVFCAMAFHPASFELFTLDIGFGELARSLIFLCIASACFSDPTKEKSIAQTIIISAMILFAVFLFAYGRAYIFAAAVIITISALRKSSTNKKFYRAVFFTTIATIVAFIGAGRFTTTASGMAGSQSILTQIQNVSLAPIAAVGGIIGVEAYGRLNLPKLSSFFIGSLWLCMAALSTFRFIRSGQHKVNGLPVYLMAYGTISTIAFSFARGDKGPEAVMASRYYIDLSCISIAIIWMNMQLSFNEPKDTKKFRAATACALCLCTLGFFITTVFETKAMPYRAAYFNQLRAAVLSPLDLTTEQSRALQATSLQVAQQAKEIQRTLNIGPYSRQAPTQ